MDIKLSTDFFSFSTMNTLVHSLLASKVSDEKSFDNLCGSPRCDDLLFSCFQDSLSFESLIIMCPQCGSL